MRIYCWADLHSFCPFEGMCNGGSPIFLPAALNVVSVDYVQVKGLTRKETGLNEFSRKLTESVVEFWIFESVSANMDDNPC